MDKISRGITAAKGPNDWPHSVTATRTRLLQLARARAQEDRKRSIIDEGVIFLSGNAYRAGLPGELNKRLERKDGTPDPADVLQSTTNTPDHRRHPLYRKSSMDFMTDAKIDHKESLARCVFSLLLHLVHHT